MGTIQLHRLLSAHATGSLPWAEATTPAGYGLDKRGVMPTLCTGGATTAGEVLTTLRAGQGYISRTTRSRNIDPEDKAAIEDFRGLCPPRKDGQDISLEVAKALLNDPALFARVLADSNVKGQSAAR